MAKKPTPKKPTIEALLNAHLAETGDSQGAFAKKHGLSKSTVQFIASGGSGTLSLDNARILAPILGRSVAELVGLDESEIGGGGDAGNSDPAIRLIPHRLIIPSALNPRKAFDEASLAELADSIVENGVLQNLIVRGAGSFGNAAPTTLVKTSEQLYELVGGERRYRAVAIAIKDGRLPKDYAVPCRITEGPEAQIRALALLENLQRQDLSPLEEADAFQILTTDCGMTTAQIAERIHKTQRFVQQRLALVTKLAPELRSALSTGTINLDQARALTAAQPKQQLKLLKDIKVSNYGLSTGEDIRRRLLQGKIPATAALFKVEAYTGETLTDDEGVEFFCDATEFNKLQKAALEEMRLDKVAEGWAFAIVVDGGWFDRSEFKEKTSTDKKKSGVVIEQDYHHVVTVHEGLLPLPMKPGQTQAEALAAYLEYLANEETDNDDGNDDGETNEERRERWKIENEKRAQEEAEQTAFMAKVNTDIRSAMDANPALALHYALWVIQTDKRHSKHSPDLLTWDEICSMDTATAAARIAHLTLFCGHGDDLGPLSPYAEQDDGVRALFAAVGQAVPDWLEEVEDDGGDWDPAEDDQGATDDEGEAEVDGDDGDDDATERAA